MAAFTYSLDVAKFVVAALDLPRWEDESLIYGDKLTFNDILKLYEARGEKWAVTYDSFEKLEKGEFTELPSHVPLYKSRPKQVLQAVLANYSISVIKGFCDISEDESLNKVFPDIKTTPVKDAIDAWFKHKQTEAEV
ncbi:putative nmra-like family protein [Phaeoacremonium minimum UCRPA7]|uniref:Putative nmra-like family protein n=1 Tax=Phaeoacremonium minimum (strain UCR-PA7) TaxID=1286976 RepID=R8B9K6_PHAM7|nr:putative nmra-like family protein [Phaeoacremonium minimum UCRPA7]EON95978.1 putative nmra-like family protein [Phaeoacremonium minimum UCRPA7]